MAWSAVSSAVNITGKLLAEEAVYLWGVEEQVDRLQIELKWMQSYLIEADAKQFKNRKIHLWVSEIRELAYDAEDVIENFALKIGSRRNGGLSSCFGRSTCIFKDGRMLHETRSKVDKIFTRITDMVRRLQAYDIKELREEKVASSPTKRRESRRPYPRIIDDNIVRLDTNIRESKVVSMRGMGGMGKTFLAKKINQHSQVKNHFDHLVWVYVSEQCQKKKVWSEILKKYLVIHDDIWNNEAWDSIKPVFSDKKTKTKILLTSRNTEVVSHADSRGYLYQLQCLNQDQSWELFQKIALSQASSGHKVEGRMEGLGKMMVEPCAGLPLAIAVLGGILATKDSVNEWQIVSEFVKSYLKRGKGHGVEEVLALSYFPEDFEIQVDRLIQLWVAEGIVLSDSEEDDGSMTRIWLSVT